MKELSIEEKARRYDEALEKAKEINNEQRAQPFNIMTKVFPELAEPEDERIRKDIMHHIEFEHNHNIIPHQRAELWIAWLKKKGNLMKALQFANKTIGEITDENYHLREKLNNQKPVEWSEEDERIRKRIIHALHGDVLEMSEIKESVAWLEKQSERSYKIIKGKNYFCVKTHNYAGVEWIKGTKYYASDNYTLVNQGCECYCPEYSKEEHNNLFKEVKYDGYVETQGEQKPAWSEEDNAILEETLYFINEYQKSNRCKDENGMQNSVTCEKWLQSLKDRVQPQSTWSGEDEKIYQSIMDDTVQENQLDRKQIEWLRDIKYRYFPQPKQEWREEDKKMCNNLIATLTKIGATSRTDSTSVNYTFPKEIDWLKSLRPQNRWKPSESQLGALHAVSQSIRKHGDPDSMDDYRDLTELYNELVKLM